MLVVDLEEEVRRMYVRSQKGVMKELNGEGTEGTERGR
jgi:hypothetical protein